MPALRALLLPTAHAWPALSARFGLLLRGASGHRAAALCRPCNAQPGPNPAATALPWLKFLNWLHLHLQVGGFPLDQVVKCLLATPVQFVLGWRFHRGAYRALRSGRCAPALGVSHRFKRSGVSEETWCWSAMPATCCLSVQCSAVRVPGVAGCRAAPRRHARSRVRRTRMCAELAPNTRLPFPCRANMDVLVSMGTNASYLYSLISMLHHHIMVRARCCAVGLHLTNE